MELYSIIVNTPAELLSLRDHASLDMDALRYEADSYLYPATLLCHGNIVLQWDEDEEGATLISVNKALDKYPRYDSTRGHETEIVYELTPVRVLPAEFSEGHERYMGESSLGAGVFEMTCQCHGWSEIIRVNASGEAYYLIPKTKEGVREHMVRIQDTHEKRSES